jgi:hypothetical protein
LHYDYVTAFSHQRNKILKTKWLFLSGVICASIQAGESINIVSPQGTDNTQGVGVINPFAMVAHLQVIYSGNDFAGIPDGGTIVSVSFRLGSNQGRSVDAIVPKIELRVSTTLSSTINPDPRFNNNVGTDQTVVFPAGPLHLTSDFVRGGINPFSLTIPFNTPFNFDPRKGNLLLDIFTYQGASVLTDFGGRNSWSLLGSLDSTVAPVSADGAFVASFNIIPIPEPGTWLLLLALIPLWGIRSTRRN